MVRTFSVRSANRQSRTFLLNVARKRPKKRQGPRTARCYRSVTVDTLGVCEVAAYLGEALTLSLIFTKNQARKVAHTVRCSSSRKNSYVLKASPGSPSQIKSNVIVFIHLNSAPINSHAFGSKMGYAITS